MSKSFDAGSGSCRPDDACGSDVECAANGSGCAAYEKSGGASSGSEACAAPLVWMAAIKARASAEVAEAKVDADADAEEVGKPPLRSGPDEDAAAAAEAVAALPLPALADAAADDDEGACRANEADAPPCVAPYLEAASLATGRIGITGCVRRANRVLASSYASFRAARKRVKRGPRRSIETESWPARWHVCVCICVWVLGVFCG